jgi:hypothetical protein
MRFAPALAVLLIALPTAASSQDFRDRGDVRDRDDYGSAGESRRGYRDMPRGRDAFGGGGARFMLQSGDTRLRVVCDERETMRACVDAATALLEKAKGAGPITTSTGTSPPTAPAPTRQ